MLLNSNEYIEIVKNIKEQIKKAQYKAALSANRELIILYWNIGNVINHNSTWGNKFVENLKEFENTLPSIEDIEKRIKIKEQ